MLEHVKQIEYDDFIKFFSDLMINNKYGKIDKYIFRGQNNAAWKLIPYALREGGQALLKAILHFDGDVFEKVWPWFEAAAVSLFYKQANLGCYNLPYIDEFVATYNDELPDGFNFIGKRIERKHYELFALAQHYGVPTRFIDWSYDVFIALYFAIKDIDYKSTLLNDNSSEYKFSIWMLNMDGIRQCNKCSINIVVPRYSINPNLAAQKGILSYVTLKYNPSSSSVVRKQFILDAEDSIQKIPLEDIISSSVFYEPALKRPFKEWKLFNEPILYKFSFPISSIPKTKNFLINMGYSEARVFPGFHKVLQSLMREHRL